MIKQNNRRENSKRIPHQYRVGDEVLIKQDRNTKFGSNPYKGPYPITEVRNNGTVRIREGITEDTCGDLDLCQLKLTSFQLKLTCFS